MSWVRTVFAVVAVSAVAAAPAAASDPWRALHRPLHLPKLDAGAACPLSTVDHRLDWPSINAFGGSGLGRGPVYPVLGPRALLTTRPQSTDSDGWAGGKLFWYVTPKYRDRVLIRGRRLDGPESMRFDGAHRSELRFGRTTTVEWDGQPDRSRGVATTVRIHAPGCYAVQIDGTAFSRVVVFAAL